MGWEARASNTTYFTKEGLVCLLDNSGQDGVLKLTPDGTDMKQKCIRQILMEINSPCCRICTHT